MGAPATSPPCSATPGPAPAQEDGRGDTALNVTTVQPTLAETVPTAPLCRTDHMPTYALVEKDTWALTAISM